MARKDSPEGGENVGCWPRPQPDPHPCSYARGDMVTNGTFGLPTLPREDGGGVRVLYCLDRSSWITYHGSTLLHCI